MLTRHAELLESAGENIELLSLLAVTDPKGLKEKLKKLGVATIGTRARLTHELLTMHTLAPYPAAALSGAAMDVTDLTVSYASCSSGSSSSWSSSSTRRCFVVVHRPCIFVRQCPNVFSAALGQKLYGEDVIVIGEESKSSWLKLANVEGWVLRDGSSLGHGELLRPLPSIPLPFPGDMPPLVVMATDGLANRLRVVLSFAFIACERSRPLVVYWPTNSVCPGQFMDAFEPLPGVTFVEDMAKLEVRPQFPPPAHDFHPVVKERGEAACTGCYTWLKPSTSVRSRIDATIEKLGNSFLSMHLRRTDHWGGPDADEAFMAFVDRHVETFKAAFMATDNATTQRKMLAVAQRRGVRMVTANYIEPDAGKLRQTSLEEAAADLFIAARADGPFKGTYSSSFSDTILRLRMLNSECVRRKSDEHTLTDAQFQIGVTLHTPGGHVMHSPGFPMESHDPR